MGISEILIILVVALLVVGPDKLPSAARSISKGLRDLRKQTREIQDTLEEDTEIGSAIRDLKSALRGDEAHTPPRKPPGPTAVPPASEQVSGQISGQAGPAGAAAGTTAAGAAAHEESDDTPADAPAFPAPVIRTPKAAVARGGSTDASEDAPEDTPKNTVDGDPEAGPASATAGTPGNDIAEKKAHG